MPNLKLALRTLAKAPFVTAVAACSLALGIGANTAIFSMFQRVLLQPLPVPEPDRLVNLAAPGPKPGSQSCSNAGGCEVVLSYPMFRDLERAQQPLTGLAAHRNFSASVAMAGRQAEGARGMMVSGSYFPVLGLRPALGRLFGPDDDRVIGGHFSVVLSHHYWASRLGSEPVVNQTMTINGHAFTIIGVAPEGFAGTTVGSRPDIYVPITMRAQLTPGFTELEHRRSYWVYAFGRLREGVALDQAAASLNQIYRPILAEVEAPLQEGMDPETLVRFRGKSLELTPGRRGQSLVGAQTATPMAMLFTVTAIVLLIACINVANLLLARATTRAREMAVRLSLGAGRGQLVAQLMTESLLLALLAGVLSLLVARWTLAGVASFLPPGPAASLDFSLSAPALLFAALLSLGTGLVFGLAPALQSTRPELISVIKADGVRAGGARSGARLRTGMVTAQIALSMALLSSAALFLRSLVNVSSVDPGLTIDPLVTYAIAPELSGYSSGRSRALFRQVEDELAAIPGVTGVAAAMVPILAGDNWNSDVAVEGFQRDERADNTASLNLVGPGYFQTVGLPVLSGREFTRADDAGGPRVVMVNEAFARKFKLGRDVIGKRMGRGNRSTELDLEIIGLVRDAKYSDVKRDIPPQFFLPYRQDTTLGSMNFYVRAGAATGPVIRAIPAVMARIDPALPVGGLKTVPQQVRETLFLDRMISVFSAAFALLATVLAAVGLYGVLAYLVAQRTREIGVRMALGADGSRVRGMVLGQVGRMAAVGGVIGVAAAVGVGRAARSILYGMEGHDPLAIAGAAVVLGLVAFAAGYLPALRASRVLPMEALRGD